MVIRSLKKFMFNRNIKSTLRNLYNDKIINFVDHYIPGDGPLSETGFKIYSNFIQTENFIKGKQDLYLKIYNSKKISNKLSKIKTLGHPLTFNDHLLYSDFLIEIFNTKRNVNFVIFILTGGSKFQ